MICRCELYRTPHGITMVRADNHCTIKHHQQGGMDYDALLLKALQYESDFNNEKVKDGMLSWYRKKAVSLEGKPMARNRKEAFIDIGDLARK